jgi:hypothetical protein
MPFFADEIEFRRWRMAVQTWLLQRRRPAHRQQRSENHHLVEGANGNLIEITNRLLWQFNLSFIDTPGLFDIPEGGGTPAMPSSNGTATPSDAANATTVTVSRITWTDRKTYSREAAGLAYAG